MARKKLNLKDGRQIITSRHAIIPLSLYEMLFRAGIEKAIDGDVECAQWVFNELIVRDREAREKEYNAIRNKGKLDHLRGLPCVACGKPANTIDHIIPLSKGGTNDIDNLQPMCWDCNRRKRNTIQPEHTVMEL